jgi:hypothetical protein
LPQDLNCRVERPIEAIDECQNRGSFGFENLARQRPSLSRSDRVRGGGVGEHRG